MDIYLDATGGLGVRRGAVSSVFVFWATTGGVRSHRTFWASMSVQLRCFHGEKGRKVAKEMRLGSRDSARMLGSLKSDSGSQ